MNQELVDYIKQQSNINVSKNKITDVLLEQGWHQSEIDAAFSVADGSGAIINDSGDGKAVAYGLSGSDPQNANSGSRKTLIIAAVLVILAAVAGIAFFSSKGDEAAGPSDKPAAPTGNSFGSVSSGASVEMSPEEKADADKAREQINEVTIDTIKQLEQTIEPPDGWVLHVGTIRAFPLAVYVKSSPEDSDAETQNFKENISIIRGFYKTADISDEAGFLAKTKEKLGDIGDNFKVISETEVKINDGNKAVLWEITLDKDGDAMQGVQLYAFKGDYVFAVTGMALAKDWEVEKDSIKNSVMSFTIPQ